MFDVSMLDDPDLLDMYRRNHVPEELLGGDVFCQQCLAPWPCQIKRALNARSRAIHREVWGSSGYHGSD